MEKAEQAEDDNLVYATYFHLNSTHKQAHNVQANKKNKLMNLNKHFKSKFYIVT